MSDPFFVYIRFTTCFSWKCCAAFRRFIIFDLNACFIFVWFWSRRITVYQGIVFTSLYNASVTFTVPPLTFSISIATHPYHIRLTSGCQRICGKLISAQLLIGLLNTVWSSDSISVVYCLNVFHSSILFEWNIWPIVLIVHLHYTLDTSYSWQRHCYIIDVAHTSGHSASNPSNLLHDQCITWWHSQLECCPLHVSCSYCI